jgi:hypothetical protein
MWLLAAVSHHDLDYIYWQKVADGDDAEQQD